MAVIAFDSRPASKKAAVRKRVEAITNNSQRVTKTFLKAQTE